MYYIVLMKTFFWDPLPIVRKSQVYNELEDKNEKQLLKNKSRICRMMINA
jgi:hypothetical protein